MMKTTPKQNPTFREALLFWLKLGFISFGGPAGQVAIMHEYLVEKKKWISESKFLHALNYCMLLPGPEAQQLATYSGWLLHGVRGGLAAGILFILPSAFILLGLSLLYVTYGQTTVLIAILDFLKPSVIGIIAVALLKIGKKSLLTTLHYILAAGAFFAMYFLNIPFPLIILAAILIGLLAVRLNARNNYDESSQNQEHIDKENDYVINQNTITTRITFSVRRIILQILTGLILWGLPLAILLIASGTNFTFWKQLSIFFTKAAFVTIGGAYAVLPYVAQVSVETFGWLSKMQMIDGLALGETTPGPLIMVLAFVGFMAGYQTFGANIGAGALGLGLTSYYTFLPSFLFIFIGAPLIERTQANPVFKTVLSYASAAVTGVILNLGVYFATAVLFPESSKVLRIPLAWTIITFIALHQFKVNLMLWIGISIAIGLLKYAFHTL